MKIHPRIRILGLEETVTPNGDIAKDIPRDIMIYGFLL